ncbi:MAG TPA: hypothetical protein VF160_04105 [Candidatus Dormibacteraeota bacterium]
MILGRLASLARAGRITGYTLEEDARYLSAGAPTLTYRMYADGPESQLNLGAFAASVSRLGPRMRLSCLRGVLADRGRLLRSRQLCLTAEFTEELDLAAAACLVHSGFTAAPDAAPGSWRYPDVRITGARPPGTAAAFAHRWPVDGQSAVVLSLDPQPPLEGGRTYEVRILESWVAFLGRSDLAVAG